MDDVDLSTGKHTIGIRSSSFTMLVAVFCMTRLAELILLGSGTQRRTK